MAANVAAALVDSTTLEQAPSSSLFGGISPAAVTSAAA